jgi:valyl-tRNA synthetase
METGYDILFFWVARMIFQGIENMGEVPFHTVYLHGLVRDDRGRKMSKSEGNVVDPLILADKYGSDALRMALITNSSPGNDQKFSDQRIEQAAHFANKLWNATRFVLSSTTDDRPPTTGDGTNNPQSAIRNPHSLPDRWITSRFTRIAQQTTQMLEDYQLGEAGKLLQEFVWNEFCDWYIEAAKTGLKSDDPAARASTSDVARGVLDGILRLLHPYMPFLTEELWQHLNAWPSRDSSLPIPQQSLMMAPWPAPTSTDDAAERDFNLVMEIIRQIRNARAEAVRDAPENIKKDMTSRRIEAYIAGGSATTMLRDQADILARLARLDPDKLTIEETLSAEKRPDKAVTLVIGDTEIILPLAGLVDLDAEKKRLESEALSTAAEITRTEELLSNEGFTSRAPAQVVERERAKLSAAHDRLTKLRERLAAL